MKISSLEEFNKLNKFGRGNLNTAFAKYFIGDSYLNKLTPDTSSLALFNVSFDKGCRNAWHIHNASNGGGQILVCTCGEGWYQEENKEPISLKEGMVIFIPANVKHWHGAKRDSYFSHIAIEVPGENTSTTWLEEVSDETYLALKD